MWVGVLTDVDDNKSCISGIERYACIDPDRTQIGQCSQDRKNRNPILN